MIIRLDGTTIEDIDTARRALGELARSWGHDTVEAPSATVVASTDRSDDKVIDPISVAALVLSIPSAALAMVDLADRIQKRRRAKELIDRAQQLSVHQVTVRLMSQNRPIELTALDPDQLLELVAKDEDPAN